MPQDEPTLIDHVPPEVRAEVQAGLADEAPRTPTITIASGAESGRYLSIEPQSRALFIGRDATCEFTIDDPSVSRRHARLYLDSSTRELSVVVQDLGSTNGTRVNNEEIRRRVLEHGDRILVGDILLRFEMLDPIDIAYRDGLARKIEESDQDPLTGLLTRAALDEHMPGLLQRCQERSWPVSAVLMDLDHFKQINDTRGHTVGDTVLQRCGEIVSATIRADDLGVRFGGEEFLIIFPGARRLHARLLAERIREAVGAEPFPQVGAMQVTASFGVAEKGRLESVTEWLERADQALYRAKDRGRNRSEAAPMPRRN